jgi:hypothetical protein
VSGALSLVAQLAAAEHDVKQRVGYFTTRADVM